MGNRYRFVRLPVTDGDDGEVKVGMDVLKKKDLGKIIETTQDLDENIHFKRVFDEPVGEGDITALPDVEDKIPPDTKSVPNIVKLEKVPLDFLERDQGFLLPPEEEKKLKKPVKKKAKKSSHKKIVKKSSEKHPESTTRVYKVTCYQCSMEFRKRTSRDILSLNPWEILCPICKKKKK